jgi:hypothetical protein
MAVQAHSFPRETIQQGQPPLPTRVTASAEQTSEQYLSAIKTTENTVKPSGKTQKLQYIHKLKQYNIDTYAQIGILFVNILIYPFFPQSFPSKNSAKKSNRDGSSIEIPTQKAVHPWNCIWRWTIPPP